jgi:NACalpha-BTF3-like transcription factor
MPNMCNPSSKRIKTESEVHPSTDTQPSRPQLSSFESDIIMIIVQTNHNRAQVVEAYFKNKGDIIDTIMDLTRW